MGGGDRVFISACVCVFSLTKFAHSFDSSLSTRSYSWSANICGIKKWTLFPPNQEHLFRDRLGNTVYDIEDVDPLQFPDFNTAQRFTLYQQPGETLFVPSGWWHQVQNIGDTISINHNWCNGSNLDLLLDSICSDLNDVEREIDHLKDMMEQGEWIETCQKLLLSNSGWDWSTLWHMCITVRKRVKEQMDAKNSNVLRPLPTASCTTATCRQDGKKVGEEEEEEEVLRRTPLFEPPLISQQPPLDLTLRRIDSVLDYIRAQKSASWFLEQIKGLSLLSDE